MTVPRNFRLAIAFNQFRQLTPDLPARPTFAQKPRRKIISGLLSLRNLSPADFYCFALKRYSARNEAALIVRYDSRAGRQIERKKK